MRNTVWCGLAALMLVLLGCELDEEQEAPPEAAEAGPGLESPESKTTGRNDDNEEVIAPACIQVSPDNMDLGTLYCGESTWKTVTVTSCGNVSLRITHVGFASGSSPKFAVETGNGGPLPTPASPLVIPPGKQAEFKVIYATTEDLPAGQSFGLHQDKATVVFSSNAATPLKKLKVKGVDADSDVPLPVITLEVEKGWYSDWQPPDGDEFSPGTIVRFSGAESWVSCNPDHTVAKWEWRFFAPPESHTKLLPGGDVMDPTLQLQVTGEYMLQLNLVRSDGAASPYGAVKTITVRPQWADAIYVELSWDTPEDPDQTDTGPEAGSDLDLHFSHPWAAGPDLDGDGAPDGWFDIPFDCFWFNAHPNWGSYDPAINDDPGLDRDDTDGGGPEVVAMNIPEYQAIYRVGVHIWNDHGYGASRATVKVLVYGTEVFRATANNLKDPDFWEVCTIHWPSGTVTPILNEEGGPYVIPNYCNPYFYSP